MSDMTCIFLSIIPIWFSTYGLEVILDCLFPASKVYTMFC